MATGFLHAVDREVADLLAELQKLVADVSNLPPDLVEKVRAVYTAPKH